MSNTLLEADALMRLLIPDGKVNQAAEALSLSTSLIYQERKSYGPGLNQNGTRNCIARLDLICELALSHAPEAVRLLGKRYLDMHANALAPSQPVTEHDLLAALSRTSRELGEAMSKLIDNACITECTVEVAQAEEWLQRSLAIIKSLKAQAHVS